QAGRRAGPPPRDRPGNARRFDLRARADRELGNRERRPPAGAPRPVSGDGLSMDRDPAGVSNVPHAGEPPAAQPLTDILLRPAARPSRPPQAPPPPVRAPAESSTDGRPVTV